MVSGWISEFTCSTPVCPDDVAVLNLTNTGAAQRTPVAQQITTLTGAWEGGSLLCHLSESGGVGTLLLSSHVLGGPPLTPPAPDTGTFIFRESKSLAASF